MPFIGRDITYKESFSYGLEYLSAVCCSAKFSISQKNYKLYFLSGSSVGYLTVDQNLHKNGTAQTHKDIQIHQLKCNYHQYRPLYYTPGLPFENPGEILGKGSILKK